MRPKRGDKGKAGKPLWQVIRKKRIKICYTLAVNRNPSPSYSTAIPRTALTPSGAGNLTDPNTSF